MMVPSWIDPHSPIGRACQAGYYLAKSREHYRECRAEIRSARRAGPGAIFFGERDHYLAAARTERRLARSARQCAWQLLDIAAGEIK